MKKYQKVLLYTALSFIGIVIIFGFLTYYSSTATWGPRSDYLPSEKEYLNRMKSSDKLKEGSE